MIFLVVALLLVPIGLLLWQFAVHRRRLRDLQSALQQRTPYLLDASGGLLQEEWRGLAATANDLVARSRSGDVERAGQLSQLEATLGSLQEGVLVIDDSNHISLINRSLSEILPDAPLVVGQRIEAVIHSSGFLAFVEDIRGGRAASQVELEFAGKTGNTWIEATGALLPPAPGGSGKWVLCVLHNITRQKRLENMRKDFVANVSHELRTPLSVIKGYVETLVDGAADMPVADRERFLRTVQRHTDRLHRILEDLLALSRLESPQAELHLEAVDPATFIAQLVGDYSIRCKTTGHQLCLRLAPDLPGVRLDAGKITQVFENLLDNAIKYTPSGSQITITIAAMATELEIRVHDNGPGIPAGDLPRIFERFYRVDKGRSREQGGTGLGLSIVKHIVQLHGGRIGAESGAGQGTTIFFTLPLSPSNGDTPPAP